MPCWKGMYGMPDRQTYRKVSIIAISGKKKTVWGDCLGLEAPLTCRWAGLVGDVGLGSGAGGRWADGLVCLLEVTGAQWRTREAQGTRQRKMRTGRDWGARLDTHFCVKQACVPEAPDSQEKLEYVPDLVVHVCSLCSAGVGRPGAAGGRADGRRQGQGGSQASRSRGR